MEYTIKYIAGIISAQSSINDNTVIEHLLFDSRKIFSPSTSLFFALKGDRRDGHQFISELYRKGIRYFVISENVDVTAYSYAVFIHVRDTLEALHKLATHHRSQFNIPVIGITGSNGKTIVKEWLYQLLQQEHNIARSPKSFNSQIGVPLSVWLMNEQHTLGIFEAGISRPHEMARLESIIQPTIGILTNIGEAHSEGFSSKEEKAAEKLLLFKNAGKLIYSCDHVPASIDPGKNNIAQAEIYNWSNKNKAKLIITGITHRKDSSLITGQLDGLQRTIEIPFIDDASIENAITCWMVMIALDYSHDIIVKRMISLQPVNMRLEFKKGINHCSIINDSYSADLDSLEMALGFLDQQSGATNKTVILSDLLQSSMPDEILYAKIHESMIKHKVNHLIGIGERISKGLYSYIINPEQDLFIELYPDTKDYIQQFRSSQFREETILVKGARVFGFEEIVQLLEQKVHQTLLEINLNAIAHNVKQYQALLSPSVKVMAMVKAFAYGSGGAEIAGILQYHKTDYLGVAYADEGVELRRAGVSLPVMVMNPEAGSFDAIIDNNLEPEVYSFELLSQLSDYLQQQGITHYPVHIEIETGMNRLGFDPADMKKLGEILKDNSNMKVQSVFSHLAASEETGQDDFTKEQAVIFKKATDQLKESLGYPFITHIANSAAIARHKDLHFDMVRLGIGMYGIDSAASKKLDLQTVATLRSTIAQLKRLEPGDSVSYNRKGKITRSSIIGTVRLGYADGYPRRLGNGTGFMYVNGKLAPVIGTVCMDMTMIDVTDIPGVAEGDEVIIFGAQLPVGEVAKWAGTIPYEIMTGISQRVKRVYYQE